MTRAELVLFDLDGTLLDGAGLPAAMRATCEVLATELPGVSADRLVAANTGAWQRLWPEVEDDYQLGGRRGDDVVEEAWRETLLACGSDDPLLLRAAVEEWDRRQRDAFRLFDDALPAVGALEAAGVRVGILTNGAAVVQRVKLESVGLLHRFDPLVVSSDTGLRKPDPRIFEVALHRAGVRPAAAWFVGDNLWHDVEPAAEAGLHTVWVDRHGTEPDPSWPQADVVLPSLQGLAAIVRGAGQEPR